MEMLDENYGPLDFQDMSDSNTYTLSRIMQHWVVIACLPVGQYGKTSASMVANNMLHTFSKSLRVGFMVSGGGGIPWTGHDNINSQGGTYGNALQVASSGGHDKTVEILLERGADVNGQGGIYGNALQAASSKGHDGIVPILLERGADVNAQGRTYGNALQVASSKGRNNIVEMLLEREADVNAQGRTYGNALQAASLNGHDKIVQILQEHGAD
ncbi:hypothetical protein N7463_007489 [Penicillium fimorum]|uniref:Uncharacterized protein n=1 Tax=Penicillium fimorum TaxID=1882269 RepID=A0A9W9XY02_9EURO|nr:hypothetical protein N7463_007489 [Penicillium fimorum]